MRIAIIGGTGYIGRHVVAALRGRRDDVVVVSRTTGNPWSDAGVQIATGDATSPGPWQRAVAEADAVINLAGARLVEPLKRWTTERKAILRESRVHSTRNVAAAIREASHPPRVLLSASGVNYYGPRGDAPVTEDEPAGDDFLARLSVEWESAAREAEPATRVVLLRTAPVIASDAPVLRPMLPFFRLGLGAWWGDERLWWSWIHIVDHVRLMLFLLNYDDLEGPFNFAAPRPVTVESFAKSLGRTLGRPVLLRVPAAALRLGLGEAADALLHLQRVIPQRALDSGFDFRLEELDSALAADFTR